MFLNMRVIFRLVENRKNNNMKMDLSHADMLKGAQCAMSKYYAWRRMNAKVKVLCCLL